MEQSKHSEGVTSVKVHHGPGGATSIQLGGGYGGDANDQFGDRKRKNPDQEEEEKKRQEEEAAKLASTGAGQRVGAAAQPQQFDVLGNPITTSVKVANPPGGKSSITF